MKLIVLIGVPLVLAALCFSADPATTDPGRKAEQTACVACHSLRLIDSQRLSAAAWGKEIDKMVGWGASVPDRQLLLEYLASQFSDAKPVPVPVVSANGVTSEVKGK
jgi:hypothetical protein